MSSGEGGQISAFLSRAGLSGRRLEACLEVCGTNWIETVADLAAVASDDKEFDKMFSAGVLRVAIRKALANADLETADVTKSSPNTPSTQKPAVDDMKVALPEGKR